MWARWVRVGGIVIGAVVLVAGSLAGGLFLASRLNEGDEASDQVVAVPDDPGVVHVHGLGVNPADGSLYAATHTGLFRIDARGRADRVGDRFQDTMAFTVVGPDRFLASGHPDMRETQLRVEGKPPLLGLVESADRGQTWRALSLLGDADLHAIDVVGGTIFAYDSSGERVRTSDDGGRTWESRSSILLRDLAVDPADAKHAVAVTGDGGLVESFDGARAWRAFATAGPPGIVALGWKSSVLWAGTEDGTLARFDGRAVRWETVRRFDGPIEAIAVEDDAIHVAVYGVGIYRASAGGLGWRKVYSQPAADS